MRPGTRTSASGDPSEERGPGSFVLSRHDAVADADERQPEEALVGEKPVGELGVGHPEVAEARVAPGLRRLVGDGPRPESIDESAQLGGCQRLAPDVDEMDLEAALLEEALRGAGGRRIGGAEDLDDRAGPWRRSVPRRTIRGTGGGGR